MQPNEQSDLDLVAAVQAGREAAFDELMARYKRPVLNFAYRMLGNAADADDIAQEVFVRAYQHLDSYRPGTKFSTWLFALARNACIDRLRYRKRHPTEPLDDAVVAASRARGPSAEAANRETGAHIATAVSALPEDQRTAIVLAEYHGLSCAEIAASMRCSEKSVESRLYRAKETLRKRLQFLLK